MNAMEEHLKQAVFMIMKRHGKSGHPITSKELARLFGIPEKACIELLMEYIQFQPNLSGNILLKIDIQKVDIEALKKLAEASYSLRVFQKDEALEKINDYIREQLEITGIISSKELVISFEIEHELAVQYIENYIHRGEDLEGELKVIFPKRSNKPVNVELRAAKPGDLGEVIFESKPITARKQHGRRRNY